ncbi:MAG: hypothetical protein P1V97_28750 [Planctomycetota bacterium]|nr:hypothetical protein [Planctomycetota bacterium]
MDYVKVKKSLLYSFLVFLVLTALMGIGSILTGGGEAQFKILFICLTISMASISALSCAAAAEKKRQLVLAFPGIGISILSALLCIGGVLAEVTDGGYWQLTIIGIVFSIGLSHACLLGLANLAPKFQWTQPTASASILFLSSLISAAVAGGIRDVGFFMFLGVISIIVGLETIAIPILMMLERQKPGGEGKTVKGQRSRLSEGRMQKVKDISEQASAKKIVNRLVLERVDADLWTDKDGKKYKVEELEELVGGEIEDV